MPTKATWLTIIVAFLFAAAPHIIQSVSASNNSFRRIRNQYLRIYLTYKKDCMKHRILASKDLIKDRANEIYQSILSKYYDANGFYYSLSAEERELIDQIINLHF
jgi:hypothetical protein